MSAKRFVPRPEAVIIGNHTYRIVWASLDEMDNWTDRQDVDGMTQTHRQLIVIRLIPDADESHYQQVLMHELTHAVWGESMTLMTDQIIKMDDVEEAIILLQSPGMLAMLRNNPDVTKYLTSTR